MEQRWMLFWPCLGRVGMNLVVFVVVSTLLKKSQDLN